MNLLERILISAYVCFICLGSLYGLYLLRTGGLDLAWAGFVATTLPPALMLARSYLVRRVARNSAPLWPYMLTTWVGVSLAAYGVTMTGSQPLALVPAGIGGSSFAVYKLWCS